MLDFWDSLIHPFILTLLLGLFRLEKKIPILWEIWWFSSRLFLCFILFFFFFFNAMQSALCKFLVVGCTTHLSSVTYQHGFNPQTHFPEFTFSRPANCIGGLKQTTAPSGPSPSIFIFRNVNTWVMNNLWRPALIHCGGRQHRQGFSEDLRRALPFIKRKPAQKRTVRELSVGPDHTHKQSKLTRSSCSTCHSTNTNRSIWGGSHSPLQTHIPAPTSSSTDVKSAYLIHISHSDRGNADLRSRREANAPCQQNGRCQNLPFEFLPPYC